MNLLVSLLLFILFWWAMLATIFSYQLHKENEDYARRLGKRRDLQEFPNQNYAIEISNSLLLPFNLKSLKFYLNRFSLVRIWQLIPLKINFK